MGADTEEMNLIAEPLPGRAGAAVRNPLENPALNVQRDDPLLEPRTDEPGIGKDGNCRPIENPG
jgi:hypothetical protein